MPRSVGLKSNSATVFAQSVCIRSAAFTYIRFGIRIFHISQRAGNKATEPSRSQDPIRIPSLPVFHFPFPSSQTMLSLSSFSLQLKVGNFSCHVYLTWQGRRRGTIAIMQIRMADYRITNCNGSNCFALTPDFSICHTQMANRPQVVTAKGRKPRNLLTKCLQTVEMVREWYVGDREQCHATICSRHSATPTHTHTHSDTISHIKKVRP